MGTGLTGNLNISAPIQGWKLSARLPWAGVHASHHHIVTHCHWVRQGVCQASAGLPVGLLMLALEAPLSSLSSAIQGLFPVAESRDRLQGNFSWRSQLLVCHHSAPAVFATRQLPALQVDVFTCIAQNRSI